MSLTRIVVAAELKRYGIPAVSTLHGFTLPATVIYRYKSKPDLRLRHGGGIAGNSRLWTLERLDGTPIGPLIRTRADLRRALRELLAGERPAAREGYSLHAKLNHNRFGSYWVWCYRRERVSP